ncbi:hypothetical protein ACFVIM_26995 [Streptomyces sp. NPDC057638]|uniref:hypothetical protein n=1 Tax=Streptomyces sp. NPDC057638 TaxID=3346190 RepID=UPI0036B03CFA
MTPKPYEQQQRTAVREEGPTGDQTGPDETGQDSPTLVRLRERVREINAEHAHWRLP